VGVAAIAGVGGWLLLKPVPANAKRIAVLPFANLSGDPAQTYFSDGIAEELRSALTRVGMEVIGRASSDAVKDLDTKTAAAKLDVANILMGSVRRSPDTIRVNAQLVSGKDGVERWARSYDREPGDAIKIQSDIATNVAQALSIALGQAGREALMLGGTSESAAQDLILQSKQLARDATGADAARKRLVLAQAAITRDPRYADAYVEKANALYVLGATYAVANQLTQADAAATKAIALASRLGSAHAVLSIIASAQLDFTKSLRETRLAVGLSLDDPNALATMSRNVAWLESGEEGLRLADEAVSRDPLNPAFYHRKSEVLTRLRRYAEVIEAGRKALELGPERRGVHVWIGDALLLLDQPAKAKTEYQAIGPGPFQLARAALLAARIGDRVGAERSMAQLRQEYGAAASYQYGQIYAQLGNADRAFAEFDNAIAAKDPGLLLLKADPFLDPIRGDPRYAALLRRLNFP
jgi:serine/threonine-protein kinase